MFITVRRFEILDESITPETVTDLVRSELVPEFEAIDGFREYFLVDSKQPPIMSVTVCDSQEAASEANRASQEFVKRSFKEGAVERVDLTEGSVLLAPSVVGHM